MFGEAFGLRLPLETDDTVRLQFCASEEEHIRQSVAMILRTRPGTRPLLPEYGCRVHELLFRPATPALNGQVAFFVEVALREWEPRIEVLGVAVTAGGAGADAFGLRVRVSYEFRHRPGAAEETTVVFVNGVGTALGPAGEFA